MPIKQYEIKSPANSKKHNPFKKHEHKSTFNKPDNEVNRALSRLRCSTRWQKLRNMILRRYPLCQICQRPAVELHHINIAIDNWNSSKIAKELADDDGLPMFEFRQGFKSFNEPSKEFEKLILEHKVNHFNNPVLKYMVSNVEIKEDPAGNIKPVKPNKDSPRKIDGVVAAIMALGLWIAEEHEEIDETSIYEERGLLTL